MYKIDNWTAVAIMPPISPFGTPGYFVSDTSVSAGWANATQDEICNVIIAAGLTPSKTDTTQLYQALQSLVAEGEPLPGIDEVEDDNDPHLGGDLNLGGHKIKNTAGAYVGIAVDVPGYVKFNVSSFITTQLIHRGDTSTLFDLSVMALKIASSVKADVNASGLRIGGSGVRVDRFLDEDDLASNSATGLSSQRAAKKYADDLITRSGTRAETLLTTLKLVTGRQGGTAYGWQTDDNYLSNPVDTDIVFTAQRDGKFNNISIIRTSASGVAISVTLYKNGVSTGITLTVSNITKTASNFSTEVSVARGDKFAFLISSSGQVRASVNVSLLFS